MKLTYFKPWNNNEMQGLTKIIKSGDDQEQDVAKSPHEIKYVISAGLDSCSNNGVGNYF